MSTITHEAGVQSLHDHVVNLVAQRWAKSAQSKVTVNTGSEKKGRAGFDRNTPDLVGWKSSPKGTRVEWIAEVETKESLSRLEMRARWQDDAALGVPFYLFVPKGCRARAEQVAVKAGVTLNSIYEYAFVNETLQLL